MDLKDLWAKTTPFQSVITHGLISGRVAQYLCSYYISDGIKQQLERELTLDDNSFKQFIGYLVSLHDIGKIEFSFQAKDPETKTLLVKDSDNNKELLQRNVRHEKSGQRCIRKIWNERGEERRSSLLFSKIIGAHHQGKSGPGCFHSDSKWFGYQKEFEKEMRKYFLLGTEAKLPEVERYCQGTTGALLLGIMILSDWISSSNAFADAEDWIYSKQSGKILGDKINCFLIRSGLSPTLLKWPEGFCDIWKNIPAQGRRPLQVEIEVLFRKNRDPFNVVLIEAPMGEGKTEAGIYAALQMAGQWKKDGLYVALPTSATANQMVNRVRDLLEMHCGGKPVRLLHAMAWMENTELFRKAPDDEADQIAQWLNPVKRGLLGQFAVGTVDQAMLAATIVKNGELRLLGLANKVLIIDEIHSYDQYMMRIIVRLLEWCKALEIPVVLLSATLPPEMKKQLFSPYTDNNLSDEYPVITAVTDRGELIEQSIDHTSHILRADIGLMKCLCNTELVAKQAVELVRNGGCICVLMNTVKEAQDIYLEIKRQYQGDILLFHSQFTAQRRNIIEKECIRRYGKDKTYRPEQSILVATQVVEQSLDVDFDSMITAVAPIDLVIQRLGRVFRHEETKRPRSLSDPSLYVLIPSENGQFGSSAYVYPETLLKSCIRALADRECIRIPEDIACLVQKGYDPSNVPFDEIQEWFENKVKEQVQAGASQQYLINPPDRNYNILDESLLFNDESGTLAVRTRMGDPTVRIAVLSRNTTDFLEPYVNNRDGKQWLDIWNKDVAEQIMLRSVSVRKSRLGEDAEQYVHLFGAKLLSGTWIYYGEEHGCELQNGKKIIIDEELGLLIKEKGA